ncbi:MAG: P27 family phage terminase small subunit [Actinomycetota bacterium]
MFSRPGFAPSFEFRLFSASRCLGTGGEESPIGKRGPIAKSPEAAQGHRTRNVIALPGRRERDTPEPPEGLLPATTVSWATFWADDIAGLVREVNVPVVARLFELYDQRARAMEVVKLALVVKGSTGQVRVNPLADYVLKLEGAILRLENELGLTPMARLRLGITYGDAVRSLEDLYRDIDADQVEAAVIDIGPAEGGFAPT